MKFKFNPNQDYQLDAIKAVKELFAGQRIVQNTFFIKSLKDGILPGMDQLDLGIGNKLEITAEQIFKNLKTIQENNFLETDAELLALGSGEKSVPYNFSVEMETGTGKTYVYLRTIYELHKTYGFSKFIIVVPSVAIREGVKSSFTALKEHFNLLYENTPVDFISYDSKQDSKVRSFATNTSLQIMLINIQAFNKDLEGDKKGNNIYKELDRNTGRALIEFIRATKPIVVIDEPQSVEGQEKDGEESKSQKAIMELNPLCTLRYSATHRNPYNLVYRLDPIQAFSKGLVKQIIVSSVMEENSFNSRYLKVENIQYDKKSKTPTAKVTIDVQEDSGPKRKTIAVKNQSDLHHLSKERACYDGITVNDIVFSAEDGGYVEFSQGIKLNRGEEIGGVREDIWKYQIQRTIERHLQKERELNPLGIKVLSLFFIDKVSNYREYDDAGNRLKGKFARYFEEVYQKVTGVNKGSGETAQFVSESVEEIHGGYFSVDNKKREKDTNGNTQADFDTYELIMKAKEELLSFSTPLRFIFSHSALREGWDNPNVFQICTLNETDSKIKKRQEIGRGLRLPVNQDGERIFDTKINQLTVVANESYEVFAKKLQGEYEEEYGITFGKLPVQALSSLTQFREGLDEPVMIGREGANRIVEALTAQGLLDKDGKITKLFDPNKPDFKLILPDNLVGLEPQVIDVLLGYRIDKHIKQDGSRRKLKLKKGILADERFIDLWEKIKGRTWYELSFETEELILACKKQIKAMVAISAPAIQNIDAKIKVEGAGIKTDISSARTYGGSYDGELPDILTYLEVQTALTRHTLAKILTESQRLADLFKNPQKFMDEVSTIIKREIDKLTVDGIVYRKLSEQNGSHWYYDAKLFDNPQLEAEIDRLVGVKKSVYEEIEWDSTIEKQFALDLDARNDIELFIKLPRYFTIPTPFGTYNPDWAILLKDPDGIKKHKLYLVRETKGIKNWSELENLRSSEAMKVKCGKAHFDALDTGVEFDVVREAGQVRYG